MIGLLKTYRLRRPFSRRINTAPESLVTVAGRAKFLTDYGPLAGRFALPTALLAALHAYGRDGARAEAMLDLVERRGFVPELRRLTRQADLRKFLLSCLRAWFRDHDALPAEAAESLARLSAMTDETFAVIHRPAEPADDAPPPLSFDYAPRRPARLTIHVYVRAHYYGPGSRPHDIGPRFQTALDGDGVDCRAFDPASPDDVMGDCDLALIDDTYCFAKSPEDKRRFLDAVRKKAGRMLMVEFDPWAAGLDGRIAANGDLYDGVWLMAPSLIDRATMTVGGLPVTVMPFPVGAGSIFDKHRIDGPSPALPPLRFVGGVEPYNYFRYFWILAASALPHSPAFKVTGHGDDGLSALDSLDRYVGELAASYGCLNFMMRDGGRSTMVGRSSDSLRLGQLLVQERCADMHAYLTPGEHYIEFTNIGELAAIAEALNHGPTTAHEAIRRAGAAFFAERYGDDAVLRHLVTVLDWPRAGGRT